MKLKIFKHQKIFQKGGFHTNPDIAWEIVLYVVFALILCSFIFGFYLFMQMNKEFDGPDTDNTQQSKIIKKQRIVKVLEYFFERKEKSNTILNSPAPIIDPSL